MIDTSDSAHRRRLHAFGLTPDSIRLLQSNAGFARQALPALLEQLHQAFDPWPEIRHALEQPAVHGPRLAHWERVICGELGDGFYASAQALAEALYRHGAPAYAVTLCHRTVSAAVVARLAPAGSWGWRRGQQQRRHAAMTAALSAAAWLDLEVLLETYAVAEQDARRALMHGFAQRFETGVNGVIDGVTASTQHLATSVHGMGETAALASERMGTAAGAAREASENINTVAAATEELTASIREITRQVTQSADIASRAVRSAAETDQVVQTLSDAAGRIGDVVRLIGDIAGQTNLLALNATIEAARAGDSGKGFAVVASEVKGLASQTSRATDDIRQQIEQMQSATQGAVQAIRSISTTVGEMGDIATAIAAAVEQQGSATAEISRSVQGAADGNRVVDQQMEGLRDTAATSHRMTGEVDQETRALNGQVQELSGSVRDFLRQVRAA
ncbi:globin-coupled sensor protein [Roseomonas haemaphysalidis]|nr:globin-coupled sensor protein [Roseomonas haemaphysalidis]